MHQSHNSEIRFKKIPNIVEMESSPLFFSIQDFFGVHFTEFAIINSDSCVQRIHRMI